MSTCCSCLIGYVASACQAAFTDVTMYGANEAAGSLIGFPEPVPQDNYAMKQEEHLGRLYG
jgi:hypothetical protein